ncbi:MAG: ABC transporter ATP-binding protein [Aquificae bacterium]|nr:ABC transporter ATP-binding protein [Aquificota bacterium]
MGENLRWFLGLFAPFKVLLALAVFGALLEGLAVSGLSFVLRELVDGVLVGGNLELLAGLVSALVLLGLLKQVGFLSSELFYKWTVARITARLRLLLFRKFLLLPLEEFQKLPPGEWIGRITNDLKSFREYSEAFGVKLVREAFSVLLLTAVLLYFDWQLFLLFLLMGPVLVRLFNYFGAKRKKYSAFYQETFARFINFVSGLVEGFEGVKFFRRRFLLSLFSERLDELFRAEFRSVLYSAGYLSAVELTGYLFAALILLWGGWRVASGDLSAGTFVSFVGTLFLLYNSLQALQRAAVNYKALEPVLARVRELLDLPAEGGGTVPFSGLRKQLEVEELTYPAEGGHSVLKEVNLRVERGFKVLVKGPSGGGKSTLLKVLSGLLRSYGGRVLYDGIELREFEVSSLRRNLFYLPQKVVVLNDTVENNLRVVKPEASEAELVEALRLAKADFVFKLPRGLKTVVGGGGLELSGGQRQRLALARLFLLRPSVALLDEATSALDPETEREVLKNLLSTFEGRTLFFVSHREGYEGLFDLLLEVEGGRVRAL